MNSPDYLTYKKSKINPRLEQRQQRSSRLRIAFWIFIITFSIIFALVVQMVRRYSTRIDIEYGRNIDSASKQADNSILSQGFGNEAKKLIGNRLKLIQLEENAPSEAKIISNEKNDNEVIDLEQYAKLKEEASGSDVVPLGASIETTTNSATTNKPISMNEANVEVYSKVLIGKYETFEDARSAQDAVREVNRGTTPFIRKVGDIYALQVGSYQDLEVAKQVASRFRAENFDVWIYQQ